MEHVKRIARTNDESKQFVTCEVIIVLMKDEPVLGKARRRNNLMGRRCSADAWIRWLIVALEWSSAVWSGARRLMFSEWIAIVQKTAAGIIKPHIKNTTIRCFRRMASVRTNENLCVLHIDGMTPRVQLSCSCRLVWLRSLLISVRTSIASRHYLVLKTPKRKASEATMICEPSYILLAPVY